MLLYHQWHSNILQGVLDILKQQSVDASFWAVLDISYAFCRKDFDVYKPFTSLLKCRQHSSVVSHLQSDTIAAFLLFSSEHAIHTHNHFRIKFNRLLWWKSVKSFWRPPRSLNTLIWWVISNSLIIFGDRFCFFRCFCFSYLYGHFC